MALIPVILIITFIAFVAYFVTQQQSAQGNSRTNQRMWAEAAHYQHLQLYPPDEDHIFPAIRGTINGMSVEVWGDFDEKGFGLIFCKATFVRHLPFRLNIVKGNFEREPAGAFFEISGLSSSGVFASAANGNALQEFLTTKKMSVLKNCFSSYHSGKMTEKFLILGEKGINDGLALNSFIERVATAAVALAGDTKEETPPPIQPSSGKDFQENLSSSSEKEIAIPAVPVSGEASPQIINQESEVKQKSVTDSGIQDLSAEELAKELFSSSFAGEKEKAIFQRHIGKSVQWSGMLKSVYPYSTDFVFGKGPGTKATFEICEVASSYGMKNKIKATVSLGEEALPILKGKTGETFVFSGKLLKFEPFAREILLEKGSLQG